MTSSAISVGSGSALVSGTTQVGFGGQRWYVAGFNGSGIDKGDGAVTLLAKGSMGTSVFSSDGTNVYQDSAIQAFVNALPGSFDPREQDVMAGLTLNEVGGTQPAGQKIWLLGADEASAVSSSVLDLADGAWWTRTPSQYYNPRTVSGGIVNDYGPPCTQECVVRPGTAIDLSNILYAAPIIGAKGTTVGTMNPVAFSSEIKFTILDNTNLSLSIPDAPASLSVAQGSPISLDFSGAQTGTGKYVSCVLVSQTDNLVKYYAKLSTAASGTLSVPISAGVQPGNYTLLLYSEQIKSGDNSDYASTPVSVSLTVTGSTNNPPALKPNVPSTAAASVAVNSTYTLDLSTIFYDPDNNPLTYRVYINGSTSAVAANRNYSFTPTVAGITTLRFTAYDSAAESPSYTVTLTATNVLTTGITVRAENSATAIGQNGQLQLYYTVQPANTTNKAVTWTVDLSGAGALATGDIDAGNTLRLSNITSEGTVRVRATAQDGSGVYGELTLNIKFNIVTGISVSAANEDLATGDSTQMTAVITPSNAYQGITWSLSSGSDIASIWYYGLLTSTGYGTVTVRATAQDGSGVYSEKTLFIKGIPSAPPAPRTYAITSQSITLRPAAGEEFSMDCVSWQSSTTFSGLLPNTTYNFYARIAETDTMRASPASPALTVTTSKSILYGSVSVTGTFQCGLELTAVPGVLSAAPPCTLGTLSYQWTRDAAAIPGATAVTYTLGADDYGKVVNVTVTAENCTGSVSSQNTVATAKGNPVYTAPTGLTAFYGDTLSDVALPAGFTWEASTATPVGEPGSRSFQVTYTPDEICYNIVTGIPVTVTVYKATPLITSLPSAPAITYGDPLSFSYLSDGTASVAGIFAWADRTIKPAVSDSNTTEYTVTFMPTDTVHYNTVNVSVTLTVYKATPYVTQKPSATAITYGQTLADSTLHGGTANVPGSFAWTDSTVQPALLGGGTTASYAVTFTPADTANYSTAMTDAAVTVNRAAPSITAVPIASAITYGQTLSNSMLSDGTASVAGSFTWTNETIKPAVSDSDTTLYSVTFTPADTFHYNTTNVSVTLTVNKATPAVTATPFASAITYGQTLSNSMLSGGTASVPGSFAWTDGSIAPSVADSGTTGYLVTFTPANSDNYNTAATMVTLAVNKATPTIAAAPSASAIVYGQTLTNSTLTGGTASVPGSFAWTDGTIKPAVSDSDTTLYSVTFIPADTDNYNTAATTVTLSVNKVTPSIFTVPSASAIAYGQTLSNSALTGGTASIPGSFIWTDGTIMPSVSDSAATKYSVTFMPADADNYSTAATTVTLTVNKATPSITAAPAASAITYGQTLSDSILSGGAASVPGSLAWTDGTIAPAVSDSDATAYSVTFTPIDTDNYSATTATVTLTVYKAATSVKTVPDTSPITYGQMLADSALTGGAGTVPGSFIWTDRSIMPAVSDSGITAYSVTFIPSDGNYSASESTVTLIIHKAAPPVTVTASADSVRYKDTVTLTAVIVPQTTASSLSGSITFTIGSTGYGAADAVPIPGDPSGAVSATVVVQVSELPGNYTITAAFSSTNPNYTDSAGSAPLIVIARDADPYYSTGFYTGDLFAWTTGPNSNTATLTLSAVIRDNNIPSGDVRAAKVTFYLVNGSKLTPISSAKEIPVGLIDESDGTAGIASAVVQLNIGKSDSQGFNIAVGISGGYTNDPFSTVSDTVVTVAKLTSGGRILGGGDFMNGSTSEGLIKGADSAFTHYTFDVSYNNKQTNASGRVQITVRSYYKPDGTLDSVMHEYIITSNSITQLSVTSPTATFSSKATLMEKLRDGTIVSIGGSFILQMTLTDGSDGSADSISITLVGSKSAGGLWFSNSWDPSTGKSNEQNVTSGSEISVK